MGGLDRRSIAEAALLAAILAAASACLAALFLGPMGSIPL